MSTTYLPGPHEGHAAGPHVYLYLGKSPGGNVLSLSGNLVAASEAHGVQLYRVLPPSNPFGPQETLYAVTTVPWSRIWSVSVGRDRSLKRHRNPSFRADALALLTAAVDHHDQETTDV